MLKNLNECKEKSLKIKNSGEFDAKFRVEINGENWNCYTVAMSHREFTLYCTQGTATFVVDIYGDKSTCELFDWDKDN